jgi:drug/metabolite transporter (DMT)-like permease
VLALTLSLGASIAWGASDFIAGLRSRTTAVLTVLLVSQVAGLVLYIPFLAVLGGPAPSLSSALLGCLAGTFYLLGLAALYRGLAGGIMAIVAPMAAVDAVIPVGFGLLTGDHPGVIPTIGSCVALAGVILASLPAGEEDSTYVVRDSTRKSIAFGLVAALGFGCFMVALAGASDGGALWAVGYSRVTSVILVVLAVGYTRITSVLVMPGFASAIHRGDELKARGSASLAAIGGLDVGATVLFALATTGGLLSLVAIMGSLYPVFTVLLAAAVLRERPHAMQRAGAAGALLGAALIAAG